MIAKRKIFSCKQLQNVTKQSTPITDGGIEYWTHWIVWPLLDCQQSKITKGYSEMAERRLESLTSAEISDIREIIAERKLQKQLDDRKWKLLVSIEKTISLIKYEEVSKLEAEKAILDGVLRHGQASTEQVVLLTEEALEEQLASSNSHLEETRKRVLKSCASMEDTIKLYMQHHGN